MSARPRPPWSRLASHDSIVLILVIFGLAAGTNAAGATVKAHSHHAAVPDGHRCKCKSCRGLSSCCCAKARAKATAPARPASNPPAAGPVRDDSGPCVGSAPCGEGTGLPASASGLATNKAVSATDGMRPPTLSVGRAHVSTADSLRPAMLASRLDDPPEGSSLA